MIAKQSNIGPFFGGPRDFHTTSRLKFIPVKNVITINMCKKVSPMTDFITYIPTNINADKSNTKKKYSEMKASFHCVFDGNYFYIIKSGRLP